MVVGSETGQCHCFHYTMYPGVADRVQVHLGTGMTHTLHLVELSEAMARKAGEDCAVEIELASTDHVDLVSVAASLDLAEERRLAEGVYHVVLSARLVQVLVWVVARLGGPIQVGLGVAVCHAELLGPIDGVLQAWPLLDCSVWNEQVVETRYHVELLGAAAWGVVLDGVQLLVLESNLVQRTELRLSGDHRLGGALVILKIFQTVPSILALVTCTHHPGCVYGARAGPARLASGTPSAVCQQPATPQLLRSALLPGTCCVGGKLVY